MFQTGHIDLLDIPNPSQSSNNPLFSPTISSTKHTELGKRSYLVLEQSELHTTSSAQRFSDDDDLENHNLLSCNSMNPLAASGGNSALFKIICRDGMDGNSVDEIFADLIANQDCVAGQRSSAALESYTDFNQSPPAAARSSLYSHLLSTDSNSDQGSERRWYDGGSVKRDVKRPKKKPIVLASAGMHYELEEDEVFGDTQKSNGSFNRTTNGVRPELARSKLQHLSQLHTNKSPSARVGHFSSEFTAMDYKLAATSAQGDRGNFTADNIQYSCRVPSRNASFPDGLLLEKPGCADGSSFTQNGFNNPYLGNSSHYTNPSSGTSYQLSDPNCSQLFAQGHEDMTQSQSDILLNGSNELNVGSLDDIDINSLLPVSFSDTFPSDETVFNRQC